jgi:hypothetical protein
LSLYSRHREAYTEATAPLLGTGAISLEDKPKPVQDEEEGFDKSYGAVDPSPGGSYTAAEKLKMTDFATNAAMLKTKPHMPNDRPILWLFHLLQGVAVIAALCLLVTQAIPIILSGFTSYQVEITFLSLALKAYISLFCITFILVESNLPIPFLRTSELLQAFISRGFIYSFLGLICVEEAYSERVRDIVSRDIVNHSSRTDEFHIGWLSIFMQISSWFMLGVGAFYMLLGVFCLRGLRDRMQRQENEDWKKYREDLKVWTETYTLRQE